MKLLTIQLHEKNCIFNNGYSCNLNTYEVHSCLTMCKVKMSQLLCVNYMVVEHLSTFERKKLEQHHFISQFIRLFTGVKFLHDVVVES